MSASFHIKTLPASHDVRPERPDRIDTPLDSLVYRGLGVFTTLFKGRRWVQSMFQAIEAAGEPLGGMNEAQLQGKVVGLREQLLLEGLTQSTLVRSFATIREVSHRVLGMRHYGSQLRGGLALMQGMVAEMETGEGKTLMATLPAATAAMAGIPVHVISVNDYLTARDAEIMGPLYKALGLKVGCVVHGQTPDQRREAYNCPITYATNKELVFDYLRDRLTLGERVDSLLVKTEYLHSRKPRSKEVLMRGLHFAIVDEADSILIDEARTPLIISGGQGGDEEKQFLRQALDLADRLEQGVDFTLDMTRRQVLLSEAGKARIEKETCDLGPLWKGLVRRESTLYQALTALHFFHRDEQYLLDDGKVQIIDEYTGRVMADRSWEQGLHQLIEMKEGCELTQRRETLAKISFQKFFRRYLHLSGMTGTAKEVSSELRAVYHLQTIRIPTHRPVIRHFMPNRVFARLEQKWEAVVQRIAELHALDRPVLVGTRTVAASEHLSRLLSEKTGIPHAVLNARKVPEEAEIVKQAGQPGAVTLATNMAGRGTDIKLGKGVVENGGLHVILTERHEASRIDRQLAGRCGRQGDPGSFEAILSLEDSIVLNDNGVIPKLAGIIARKDLPGWPGVAKRVIRRSQRKTETRHRRIRRQLFKMDEKTRDMLMFSGRME